MYFVILSFLLKSNKTLMVIKMKKKYVILSLAAFFALLFTMLPIAHAKSYKHITYGDAMASFQSVGVYGIELRGLGFSDDKWDDHLNYPSPITFDERIYPWVDDYVQTVCEHDAFFISVGMSFWSSDFDFFGMTMDDLYWLYENYEFEFYVDGIQLETIKTDIKPIRFVEWVIYDYPPIPDGYVDTALYTWRQGTVFKAGELDVGVYELNTKVILDGWLYWEWTTFFKIAECWH